MKIGEIWIAQESWFSEFIWKAKLSARVKIIQLPRDKDIVRYKVAQDNVWDNIIGEMIREDFIKAFKKEQQ